MLLKMAIFAEKYELKMDTLNSALHNGTARYKTVDGFRYVDEKYLLRRVAFKAYVKEFNQEVYYLLSEYFTVAEMTRVSKLERGYLEHNLFALKADSILSYRVTPAAWEWFRFFRSVVRLLRKRQPRLVVGYILDRRMDA